MANTIILAEKLGKAYQIATTRGVGQYRTLQEEVVGLLRRPFARRDQSSRRETFWALRDISFEVREGEAVGIIGRNGAGKSTLLKILSRITRPTSGRAEIRGRVGSLLEVGTGFHQELTGRENVFLNGAILGMSRSEIKRRFDEIVAFAEVEQFLETPVKRYSSGMYMRLAFAVAAHLDPEILIVDEVLAVGDAQFQRKCLAKMSDVASTGRTVLFVSHNMPAITRLCSRAILLERGQIVAEGDALSVVEQYTTSEFGTSAQRTWDDPRLRPGTNGFMLLSVGLFDEDETLVTSLNIERPVHLSIKYQTETDRMRFRCAVIFNTQGTCAFVSMEPEEMSHEQAGVYESIVEIPANLLAEGEYTVDISIFASRGRKEHLCRVQDAIAFQVYDSITGKSARGDYSEGIGGVMRPLLTWRIAPLEPKQLQP